MAESVESTAPSFDTFGQSRRTLWQRFPWLWYDYVVARSRAPLWLLSLVPFAINYSIGVLLAVIAGELPQFLADLKWVIPFVGPAFCAFFLGYMPRVLDGLWANMQPWVENSDAEFASFRDSSRDLLMSFFWLFSPLWIGFYAIWAFLGPTEGSWAYNFAHPEIIRFIMLLISPLSGYFIGAGFAAAALGPWTLALRIRKQLRLRSGFILESGKSVLQPFNQLLWAAWGLIFIPGIILSSLAVLLTVPQASSFLPFNLSLPAMALTALGIIPSLVIPQLAMNRWLAVERDEELTTLHSQLRETASLPEDADTVEGIRRMLRHQHLIYEIQQVQNFTPTLVDVRFVAQIATSVVAILLATILIRTILPG